MASNPKRGLAIAVILVAFIVGALDTYFLIVAPEQSFDFINTVKIKLLLIIACNLLLLIVGLLIYNRLDVPSPRKMLYRIMRTIIVLGTALTGAPVGITAIIKQLKVLRSEEVSLQSATHTALFVFISMMVGLWLLYREFRSLAEFEYKNGPLP